MGGGAGLVSTNFYWSSRSLSVETDDPYLHIGKQVSIAGGCKFIFAQPDFLVVRYLMSRPDAEVVADEYGRAYTGSAFMEALALMTWDHDVGGRFS